jgi:hypothetical protein
MDRHTLHRARRPSRMRARDFQHGPHLQECIFEHRAMLAAEAVDGKAKVGLFVDRAAYAHYNDPVCARMSRKEFDELCYISARVIDIDLNSSALMSRGWVLQERLLSPRSVYFEHKLEWECPELLASEHYPDGVPRDEILRPWPNIWGHHTPFRLKNIILDSQYVADESNPQSSGYWSSKYECWRRLVEIFSHCNLTYESDYLLALSGLAKHFIQEFDDDYLAGIRRKDIFHQLLWYRVVSPQLIRNDRTSPQDYLGESMNTPIVQASLIYVAPTWSWASKKIALAFLFDSDKHEVYSEVVCITEVHEAAVILKNRDPTGNVSASHIRMTGHMRKSKSDISKWIPESWASRQCEWYDEGYDTQGCRKTGDTYHFLMAYKPYQKRSYERRWEELKIGLILEMAREASSTHKRVGMFVHPRHDSFPPGPYDKVPPLSEECTEFSSFDPENYERHTVTVI